MTISLSPPAQSMTISLPKVHCGLQLYGFGLLFGFAVFFHLHLGAHQKNCTEFKKRHQRLSTSGLVVRDVLFDVVCQSVMEC